MLTVSKKKYYFLAGLPRSGNTLLASILNQNNQINVSANSLVSSILYSIVSNNFVGVEESLIFKNFPDKKSLVNCISGCFESYYKDWTGKVIIDRSNWGTPYNLKILEDFCPNELKFICPVRPTLDILCSFINLYEENKLINVKDKDAVRIVCEQLMAEEGVLSRGVNSVLNLSKSKYSKSTLFVSYENLCLDTQAEIERIYQFIGLDKYNHNYTNITQYKINGVSYNDNINQYYKNLHKLRAKISKRKHKIHNILPKDVVEKYSNLSFTHLTNQASAHHLKNP